MATPETNEKCYYVQHDPHKCTITLEKFHFNIFCRFGVIEESLLGGAESAPPGEIGLKGAPIWPPLYLICFRCKTFWNFL